ncbi:protein arginine N-methyltransferase 1.6-like [Phaseolus vulgaris]|uniref:protein arginine N-methyltransferase 1.6-like n=1 Tax=Phaseolus vulgaris TaxID=3885 RepID=UPI0035C9A7A8
MSLWPTNNLEQISVASTSDPGVRNHGTKTSCLYIRPESPQSTSNLEQIPVASTSDPGVQPFKIFEFDFWKRPESYGETELYVKATNDGRVHVVISWWVLRLDQEGTIYYSTAPRWTSSPTITSPVGWSDHWKQCVWFVPGSGISILKGEEIHLLATHTETSFSYNFDTRVPTSEILNHKCMTGDFQLVLPPERAAIYADKEWRLSMLKAVQSMGKDRLLCLVVDDSVVLPLLVAKLSEASVM